MDELFSPAHTPALRLPVPHVLDAIGWRHVSGKVQIATDSDINGIFVDRGRLIAATSSHRSLRLGHVLLQRGAVEPLFLHDVIRGVRPAPIGQALGGALLREGAVTREHLAASVEEQVIEVLSRVLGMDDASFVLIADEPLPAGIEIVPLDVGEMLDAAIERQAQRASARAMQRLLPRHDVPLRMAVQLSLVSVQLTDVELLVSLQIERGHATIERLADALPLDRLTLNRTIIALMERGYLVMGI